MSKYSYEFKKTVVLEYLAGSDSGYYQYCRILQLAGGSNSGRRYHSNRFPNRCILSSESAFRLRWLR